MTRHDLVRPRFKSRHCWDVHWGEFLILSKSGDPSKQYFWKVPKTIPGVDSVLLLNRVDGSVWQSWIVALAWDKRSSWQRVWSHWPRSRNWLYHIMWFSPRNYSYGLLGIVAVWATGALCGLSWCPSATEFGLLPWQTGVLGSKY